MTASVRIVLAICTTIVLCIPASSRAAEFYRLGGNVALGVSPDGSLVLTTGGVWTPARGLVPHSTSVFGRDISNNGYFAALVDGAYVPARARVGEPVLELSDAIDRGDAYAISADGNVVVGLASTAADGQFPFRWTPQTGLVSLGRLDPTFAGHGAANAVSADGSVVVGDSEIAPLKSRAFRWTPATGMVGLGEIAGGADYSVALGVSSDGRVVVGSSGDDTGDQAFRWTQESGMVALGDLPGGDEYSQAWAASADGSVIVGVAQPGGPFIETVAFIWTANEGMRSLEDVLVQEHGLGPALQGFNIVFAGDISDDGRTIVGYGRNADDDLEGFVVIIPEPTTATLVALAASITLLPRRPRRL